MFKKAKRIGTKPVKCIFRVEVQKIKFPKAMTEVTEMSEVSICFERGGKIASSPDARVTIMPDGSKEAVLNASLSMLVTMYKEDTGGFQQKEGKLIVRQKKKSALGIDAYKGLGVSLLGLGDLANRFEAIELNLPLGRSSAPGGVIVCSIIPKVVGGMEATFDDSLSMHSGFSGDENGQIDAADFDSTSFHETASEPFEKLEEKTSAPSTPARSTTKSAPNTPQRRGSRSSVEAMVELENARIQIMQLTQQLNESKSNYEAVCNDLSKQKNVLDGIRNDYRSADEKCEELSDQVSSLENQLEITKQRNAELQSQYKDALKLADELRTKNKIQFERFNEAQVSRMEVTNKLSDAIQQIDSLEQLVSDKSDKLEESMRINTLIMRDIQKYSEDNKILKDLHCEAEMERRSLTAINENLQSELDTVKNELSATNKSLTSYKEQSALTMATQGNEIESLRAALAEKMQEVDSLRTHNKQLSDNLFKLEKQIVDGSKETAELAVVVAGKLHAEQKLEETRKQLEYLNKLETELANNANSSETREITRSASGRINSEKIFNDVKKLQNENAILRSKLGEQEVQMQALHAQCKELESDVHSQKEANELLRLNNSNSELKTSELLENLSRMEQESAERVRMITDLENFNSALKEDTKRIETEKRAIEEALKEKQSANKAQITQLQEKQIELMTARSELAILSEQYKTLESELNKGLSEAENLSRVIAAKEELEVKYNDLLRSHQALEKANRQLESIVSELNADKDALKDKFDGLAVDFNDQLTQSRSKENELQHLYKETERRLNARIMELSNISNVNANKQTEIDGLTKEVNILSHDLKAAEVEKSRLASENSTMALKLNALSIELSERIESHEQLSQQMDLHRESMSILLEDKEASLQNAQKMIESFSEQISHLSDLLNAKLVEIDVLQETSLESQSLNDRNKALIVDLKESANRLERALSDVHAEKANLVKELDVLKNSTTNEELLLKEEEISLLKTSLSQIQNICDDKDTQIENLQNQLKVNEISFRELSEWRDTETKLAEVKRRELETQMGKLNYSIEQLDSEKRVLEKELHSAQLSLRTANIRVDELVGTQIAYISEKSALRDELDEALAAKDLKDSEIEKLTQRLDSKGKKILALQEDIYRLECELENSNKIITTMNNKYACIEENVTVLMNYNASLDADNKKILSEANLVQKKLQNAEERWRQMNGEGVPSYEVIESVMMDKDEKLQNLSEELEEIVKQLIQSRMSNASCSYELDEYKKRCASYKKRIQALAERVAALEVSAAEATYSSPPIIKEEQEDPFGGEDGSSRE